jgi:hypothetical protein
MIDVSVKALCFLDSYYYYSCIFSYILRVLLFVFFHVFRVVYCGFIPLGFFMESSDVSLVA